MRSKVIPIREKFLFFCPQILSNSSTHSFVWQNLNWIVWYGRNTSLVWESKLKHQISYLRNLNSLSMDDRSMLCSLHHSRKATVNSQTIVPSQRRILHPESARFPSTSFVSFHLIATEKESFLYPFYYGIYISITAVVGSTVFVTHTANTDRGHKRQNGYDTHDHGDPRIILSLLLSYHNTRLFLEYFGIFFEQVGPV